jgi:hypothetical protein
MIRTVGDLLQALKEEEEKRIMSFPTMSHGPSIGDMYEGTTRKLLDMAIFDGLDLKIREGFIKNSAGDISRQIDCMIVTGEGQKMPNTDHYLYDIPNVLAIVEVKKTLYGDELADSLDWSRDFEKRISEPPSSQKIDLLRDAWRSITCQELPDRSEIVSLPFHLEMIYRTLVVEISRPLRIFIGYEGYVNESGFRRGFITYLKEIYQSGKYSLAGPRTFPDVMICRNSTIYKLNGMPYPGQIRSDNFWCYLASRGIRPLHIILEFLWTRLSYKFNLSPVIFGDDDLLMEGVNPLLFIKAIKEGEEPKGWAYEYTVYTEDELLEGNKNIPWEPVEVSKVEFSILNALKTKGEIDENEPELNKYLRSEGTNIEEVIKNLREKRLIYRKGGRIRYLTDECVTIFLPDGRVVAGDNGSGRMMRWVTRFVDQYKKSQGSS